MNKFKLDDDIPIPGKKESKYPFSVMAVGQSFERPLEECGRITASAHHYKRMHPGWSYALRTNKEKGLVRLWRTA